MAGWASEGARRVATAALCVNGGFEVVLRMPGQAVSGNVGEQMGLVTPQFQDVPLSPAVWRKLGSNQGLLVDGDAVAALMGSQAASSAESLFQSAVGMVVGGVLYAITKCEPLLIDGEACAYRVSLQEPTWA